MQLNVVIVEDSRDNIDTMRFLLDNCPQKVHVIGVATSLAEAYNVLQYNKIDLALLDIQLKSGIIFEVLEQLLNQGKLTFDIVFVTAHGSFEYATKAIQYACLDFISKPIDQNSLEGIINKSMSKKNNDNSDSQIRLLLDVMKGNLLSPESISISLPKGIIEIIKLDSVDYIQADGNTCIFYINENKRLHSIKAFGYYLELLESNPSFIQLSRNCIANKNNIKRYDSRNKTISLLNGKHLIVSHRYSKNVKDALLSNKNENIFERVMNIFRQT